MILVFPMLICQKLLKYCLEETLKEEEDSNASFFFGDKAFRSEEDERLLREFQ